MSGHRKWPEVRHTRSPEWEAAIADEVRTILRENALAQLRRRKEITQEELAALGVSQVNVSRIERADEPQIATLRRYIKHRAGN
jgi:DNA-binding XRE family transcriptional regulator